MKQADLPASPLAPSPVRVLRQRAPLPTFMMGLHLPVPDSATTSGSILSASWGSSGTSRSSFGLYVRCVQAMFNLERRRPQPRSHAWGSIFFSAVIGIVFTTEISPPPTCRSRCFLETNAGRVRHAVATAHPYHIQSPRPWAEINPAPVLAHGNATSSPGIDAAVPITDTNATTDNGETPKQRRLRLRNATPNWLLPNR